jgi:hypothetical protein
MERHDVTYLEYNNFKNYAQWEVKPAIKHVKGLHQGDPLSPMFILAMNPLQRLLDLATQQGLLTSIGANPAKLRTSLFADAMLFIRPVA